MCCFFKFMLATKWQAKPKIKTQMYRKYNKLQQLTYKIDNWTKATK